MLFVVLLPLYFISYVCLTILIPIIGFFELYVADYRAYKTENEDDYNMYWRRTEYIDGEDGELSWFNAGVRVGVGIGLGVCLGLGIGVGLLVRTYQSTTRNFKRQLI